MTAQSLDKSKIKFLLLEGIHPSAVDVLRSAGYTQIEAISGALPDEEEQFRAYRTAVESMKGLPVTIRTIDIGADKPLERHTKAQEAHLNPCLLYTSDAADE